MMEYNRIWKRLATFGLAMTLLAAQAPQAVIAEEVNEVSEETEEPVAEAGSDAEIVDDEDKAEPDKEEETAVSDNKAEDGSPAFEDSRIVNGVTVTVAADEGVFPEGAVLSVKNANYIAKKQAEEAVSEERKEDVNVAASYTYDIKVLDKDGDEIQPADESKVKVSFKLDEVADENLDTNIYHITEESLPLEATDEVLSAEKLPVETDGDTAIAETDGFSLYTVEFTYENKQYVMPGDSEIPLSTILDTVGLAGEVTDVKVSDETLFSASDDSGEWIVTAHKAFDTEEWMNVTIGGVVYEITVTDTNEEQTITYTLDRKAEDSRFIYSLVGSDGSSSVVYDARDAKPTRITANMGEDITFDVYADGDEIKCDHSDSYDILGFYNYFNTNNYDFTITSKTRIIQHVQIDGFGYIKFNKAKTTLGSDGNDKTITVHWEGGSGGNRLGAPGKFIVTFAPPAQTYNISYVLNGGTNSSSNPATYDDNKALTLADPTRTGYTFKGWYDNAGFSGSPVTCIPKNSSGDKTLYAKWEQIPAVAPTITKDPVDINLITNNITGNVLSVTATAASGHTLSYKWYSNTSATNTGGTAISGATTASYTIPANTAVGTYYYYCVLTASRTDNGTTAAAVSSVATVTIKNQQTLSFASDAQTKTYGDADFTITATHDAGNGAVSYAVTSGDAASVNSTTGAVHILKAGKATITATAEETGTYAQATAQYTLTVKPKSVTITGLTVSNKVYDGTAAADVTGTPVVSGKIETDNVAVTAGTAAFSDANVGNGKTVTFSGYTLSGTAAGNYTLSAQPANVEADITAKEVTVSGITAKNKEYDGATTATLVYTSASFGKCGSDDLTVTATGAFADANVGVNKTVTVSGLALGGADAGNYALAAGVQQTSTSADITARAITINAKDQTVELSGSIATGADKVTITGGELASNQTLSTVNLNLAENVTTSTAGVHDSAIVPSGAVIRDASNNEVMANYNITYVNGKLTVTKIKAKVTKAPTVKTNLKYTGSLQALITAGVADTAMEYAVGSDATSAPTTGWSEDIPSETNAGTYYVWYRAKADDNHVTGDAAVLTVEIGKADPVIETKPTASAINYGQTLADSTLTGGVAKLGDTQVHGAFAWSNTATEPAVSDSNQTEYSVTFTPSNANIKTASCKVTLTVNKANIPDSAVNAPSSIADLKYTGSPLALVSEGSVAGGIGTIWYAMTDSTAAAAPAFDGTGDSLNKKWSTSVPEATNAGTYYVWYRVIGDRNHNNLAAQGLGGIDISKADDHSNMSAETGLRRGKTKILNLSALIEEGGMLENNSIYITRNDDSWLADACLSGSTGISLTAADIDDANGKTAEITVRVSNCRNYGPYDINVTVTGDDKYTQIISFAKDSVTLKAEETFTNELTGAETTVSYKSSDEKVATVDSSGKLTAVDKGEATITATAAETEDYYSASATFKVIVDQGKEHKVPLTEPEEKYAAPEDNFAPIASSGKINDQVLDFSKVAESDVKPSELKMTAINGSKFTTKEKLKSKDSVKTTGGVKAKVSKDLIPKITCKKNGTATFTMADGTTYTITFKVEKPKAQASAKNMHKGGSRTVVKTVKDLFGTDIDAGDLIILKQKHSQATISDNNLYIDPREEDNVKVQYKYLNMKYKMTIKIK